MKAINYSNRKVFSINTDKPEGEGVLVNISSVGICGTDLHLLESGAHSPHIAGHEISGITSDGQHVSIEPVIRCGECDCCRRGDYQLCQGESAVLGIDKDGGMTEQMLVPEYCLVKLDKNLELKDASLVEPLAVALHGLLRTKTTSQHRVAVIGGGSVGLCTVAAAQFLGCKVSLHARYDHQKEAGEKLGATEIKGSYDRVIDCAGSPDAIELCIESCAPGSWLILLAVPWDRLDLPGIAMMVKEIRVFPSMVYGVTNGVRDIERAAELLSSNSQIGKTLITHRFPLNSAEEAFDVAKDRKSGSIKVVFDTGI